MVWCLQAALHPTPAVCGRPRATAKEILASKEVFDRGFYSGPFGWLSGCAAEFVVAIRSALIHAHPSIALDKSQPSSLQAAGVNGSRVTAGDVHTHTISLFAGVGIVKGSTPEAEWQVSIPMPLTCSNSCSQSTHESDLPDSCSHGKYCLQDQPD